MAEGVLALLPISRVETTLSDGTPVLIRPVRVEDKALLVKGFERLSEESRYRRFMTPVSELTDEQLRYLTELDYQDRFAWAALRADRTDEGLGVSRYVRLPDDPEVAEAAVTVIDEYQGRGLGTILLGLLAGAARLAGIRRFRAYVLEENLPMRDLLESLGGISVRDSPGLLRLEVPLDPDRIPDSPASRVLRAAAARLLPVGVPWPF